MPILYSFLRSAGAFIIAWVVLVVVGISISVQYILAELTALGADISLGLRLTVTGTDIIGMLPLYGSIFGVGLLIAMIAAWGLLKFGAPRPHIVYTVAGFVAIAVSLWSLKFAFGLNITAIASTRTADGFLMQCVAGALAGYAFIRAKEMLDALEV